MSEERLNCEDICSQYYSSYEEGSCMESCEQYNHDLCPVVYVNGLEQEISELNKQLELTEKALELACKKLANMIIKDCTSIKEGEKALLYCDKNWFLQQAKGG